jgi:hypothetical protein
VISPPADQLLFCGMSIGFSEPSAGHPRIRRAPLSENVTFMD